MKTRLIYTKFWSDTYISNLNKKEKLLFLYLLTNEKVNLCGIYEIPDKYIRKDLDLGQVELNKIKDKFQADGRFVFLNGWIKIVNYEKYNLYKSSKNQTAKKKDLALVPKELIPYQYPIDSLSEKENRVSLKTDSPSICISTSIGNSISNKGEDHKKGELGKKKQDKIKYAEYVTLTEKEYQKLVDSYGEPSTKKMIEKLDNYKGSKGKTYKSDYMAILSWVVNVIMNNEESKIPRSFKGLIEMEQEGYENEPKRSSEISRVGNS